MAGRELDKDSRTKAITTCQSFLPQQWRQTKCKHCFQDASHHGNRQVASPPKCHEIVRTNFTESSNAQVGTMNTNTGSGTNGTQVSGESETPDIIDHCYSPRLAYTTCSSKGSSDRLDEETEDTASSKFGLKDSENEDEESTPRRTRNKKNKVFPSPFGYEQQDSIDIEEGGPNSPRAVKRRARSYHKRDSNLLQFSAMMRSSNSSLCSFTSEYTDGYSDYDYDIRSDIITDDTDDYTEQNDVIDDLESLKPELKERFQNERRISRSRILDLERELEGQQDHYRANEAANQRQILALQREIEGLKLELSSVKAHEHILALKARLEREAEANTINDLNEQIQTLQDKLCSHPHNDSNDVLTQQDVLNRDLDRAHHRIQRLEEEKTAFQERTSYFEDLHHNDKELLQVLRKQLESLDIDLSTARETNKDLQESLRLAEVTRNEQIKEQEKCSKLTKELENIRQKVKRRDRHIEDLEDDNVKLHNCKTELESQLSKRDFKMKKLERRLSEMQGEVTKCNKEIADLTGEKKTLEQVRKLTDLKLKDMQGESGDGASNEVENGKNIFIHTLEERLKHSESRAKEIQLENDTLLKDLREYCENLHTAEKEVEEYKELLKDCETKCRKLKEERAQSEKKNEWWQRRYHKSEQEKKRAVKGRKELEKEVTQYQEQYLSNNDVTNGSSQEPVDETDARMLKLKLQSTEAKLQMIEGNKGYLEKKVHSLERKLQDKELDFTRLLDSMERDSGAPSQDYDRSDSLERENITLQTRLDQLMMENHEQKEQVNQLEENNTHLDATIKNLNEKLSSCNERLKELEDANHKLGRDAYRRSQCFTATAPREEEVHGLNELRSQNKALQEKVDKFNDVEEEMKALNGKLKKEKGNSQWYSEENERLKIKIERLSQNIQSLETSKKEFEKTIHQLQETNKELDMEVKRLDEQTRVYSDLFAKDSKLSSSLRRRSYQSDEEKDEERMFKNALAPLMEEIKEKDNQIRTLHEAMEDKNLKIETLTSELDQLHQNIAAQITEKIRHVRLSGCDSAGEYEHSEEGDAENLICINNRHRSGGDKAQGSAEDMPDNGSSSKDNVSTMRTHRTSCTVDLAGRISPELQLKKETGEDSKLSRRTSCGSSGSNNDKTNNTSWIGATGGDDLTVSREQFCDMLLHHHENIAEKDLAYYRNSLGSPSLLRARVSGATTSENRYSGSESPTENKFYITIENALLDHYPQDDDRPRSALPSLLPANNFNNVQQENTSGENRKMFVEDIYEQLAEMESMVNIKYTSPQISPNSTLTIAKISPCNKLKSKNPSEEGSKGEGADAGVNADMNPTSSTSSIGSVGSTCGGGGGSGSGRMRPYFHSGMVKCDASEDDEVSARKAQIQESEVRLAEKGLDLSGLDDLLAEVNKKGNDYQEQVVMKKQKLQERHSLPLTTVSTTSSTTTTATSTTTTKTVLPSIRTTTKRKIIRLGRSESLESSSGYQYRSSLRTSSVSSDPPPVTPLSSSLPTSAQVSIILAPETECTPEPDTNVVSEQQQQQQQEQLQQQHHHQHEQTTGPVRRPLMDANKFLNSSYSSSQETKS